MRLITPTPTHVRERDGHERAVPAVDEFRELRERSGLSMRALAREVSPRLDMTEGAVRAALAKMESGHTETLRRDLYEHALDVIRCTIIARDGELSERELALTTITNATPHLADTQADLAWVHDAIAHHTIALETLRMMEGDYEARVGLPERAIAAAPAKLGAA